MDKSEKLIKLGLLFTLLDQFDDVYADDALSDRIDNDVSNLANQVNGKDVDKAAVKTIKELKNELF